MDLVKCWSILSSLSYIIWRFALSKMNKHRFCILNEIPKKLFGKQPYLLKKERNTLLNEALVNQFMNVQIEYQFQSAFFIPPAFVISSLRASIAALMRDTSLPPTYYDAFISQLSIIRTQGFFPYLAWSISAYFISASYILVAFLPYAVLSLSDFHSYSFTCAAALRSLLASDSYCIFS